MTSWCIDHAHHPAAGILVAEDFDDDPQPAAPVVEPEAVPEPPPCALTEADLAAARSEGYAAGLHAARQEAGLVLSEAARLLCGHLVEHLPAHIEARERQIAAVSESAAKLVFAALAAHLPSLALRHAASEITHLLHDLIGDIAADQAVQVSVSPSLLDALRQSLASLPRDLARRVVLHGDDSLDPGDARLGWEGGAAARRVRPVQEALAEILRNLDLLPPLSPAALPPSASLAPSDFRETEHA